MKKTPIANHYNLLETVSYFLKIFGPFHYDSTNIFLRIFVNLFKFANLVFSVSVYISTGIDTLQNISNLPIVSANMCYVFPMTTALFKIILSFFYEKKIKVLVKRVYGSIDIFRYASDIAVLKMIRTALVFQFIDTLTYLFPCTGVCITTFLLTNFQNRELPIRGYFPINVTVTPNYQIIYALQVYAIVLNMLWMYSFDMILLGIIRWITIDLKILQLNYRMCPYFREPRANFVVPEKSFTIMKQYSFFKQMKEEDKLSQFVPFNANEVDVKDDSFLERFVSCLKRQRILIGNIADTNELFSVILFVQTILNCALACMGLYSLTASIKTHRNPVNDIILLNIGFVYEFYWCMFGYLLMLQDDCLIDSIYGCGWENYISDKRISLLVINAILQTMHPLVITAGHFFDLSMKTCLEVVNKSYSFFAILNSVTTKEDFE